MSVETKDFFDQSAILVWRFKDAPKELQKLSTAGGGESWLVLVPADGPQYIGWIQTDPFGVDVSKYSYEGMTVYIGCH
jgi:hypothetical protein